MFEVKAVKDFTDMQESVSRKEGDVFIVSSLERLNELMGQNPRKSKYVRLVKAKKRGSKKYLKNKIIIYQEFLYKIGGIETFLFNITKHYKDRNITLVVKTIEDFKAIEMAEYCDVVIDEPNVKYECDILILGNYNCTTALDRTECNHVYQMIHADWMGLKQFPAWKDYKWAKDKRVSEIICVSETARLGLLNSFGIESKVIYNILDEEPTDKILTLITLSRATQEKGIDRILKMAQEFKKQNKKFIWFLCTPLEQTDIATANRIREIPEFIIITPSVSNKVLIEKCDYLVQLSDTESFCYSAFEALQRKVPVILTNFPEAKGIVQDGRNGYLLEMDLSNLDVSKIFNKIPKEVTYEDKCDLDKWEQVFNGEF